MEKFILKGVEFRETDLSPAGAYAILEEIEKATGAVVFDGKRTIHPVLGGVFAVTYGNAPDRDSDVADFARITVPDSLRAEAQIPQVCGVFEKNGVSGIILRSVARSGVTTSYAHEGVIVDPKKFESFLRTESFLLSGTMKGKVSSLMDGSERSPGPDRPFSGPT